MQQLMVRDFAIFGNDKAGIEHLIGESLFPHKHTYTHFLSPPSIRTHPLSHSLSLSLSLPLNTLTISVSVSPFFHLSFSFAASIYTCTVCLSLLSSVEFMYAHTCSLSLHYCHPLSLSHCLPSPLLRCTHTHSLSVSLFLPLLLLVKLLSHTILLLAESSLGLDSFEQFCVWQLLCAEGPDSSLVIPAIGKFDTQGRAPCVHNHCHNEGGCSICCCITPVVVFYCRAPRGIVRCNPVPQSRSVSIYCNHCAGILD